MGLWVRRRGDPGGGVEREEPVRPADRRQLVEGTRAGMSVLEHASQPRASSLSRKKALRNVVAQGLRA